MYKVLICDDEKIFVDMIAQKIKRQFDRFEENYELEYVYSGECLLEIDNICDYDLLFLDCNLISTNGIDIAEYLRLKGYQGRLIFVSSYIEYSIKGYKVNAFRYILKKDLDRGLNECITDIIKQDRVQYLEIPTKKICVKLSDILFLESINHKVIIHLRNEEKYTLYDKLSKIAEDIDEINFLRVHQSYLVNMNFIKEFNKYNVVLFNDICIPVSRNKHKMVAEKLLMKGIGLWE